MKSLWLTTAVAVLAFVPAPNDALTGLPLYPGLSNPDDLPRVQICASKMEGNLYTPVNDKKNVVIQWYASQLKGFRRYHGIGNDRTQDTFFNAAGTLGVTITGTAIHINVPGVTPDSTDVFGVSYARFTPGLPPAAMQSIDTDHQVCR